jgi:23S rRNA pseudouridine1911/1915/1917 synthase
MATDSKPNRKKPQIIREIETIFEDEWIVVINKPANLLVLPDRYDQSIANLYHLLRNRYKDIFVVHRIDRETSGLIVFAKKEESHRGLSQQFQSRSVQKIYRAICTGEFSGETGTIDFQLAPSRNSKGKMKIDQQHGKEARTNFKVLERFDDYSYIEAKPETGRTHQIRVHLSAINLPILGDSLYGREDRFYLSQIKPRYKLVGEEKPLLDRTALHASKILFLHPFSGQSVSLETDLPKDMKIVLKYLKQLRGKQDRRQVQINSDGGILVGDGESI